MNHTLFQTFFTNDAKTYLMASIDMALAEDGPDLTSLAVFSNDDRMVAEIVAKEDTIVVGLPIISIVMDRCPDPQPYTIELFVDEASAITTGTIAARIVGAAPHVLKAERIILNFITHLSGIAALTSRYVKELEGTGTRLLDTRKTLPCLRYPEKYAVRCGGGTNHRANLCEMLMLKDNHIDAAGSITAAVAALRKAYAPCPPIEVECRDLAEVHEASACRVERIMLDNMPVDLLQKSLEVIPFDIETEISGGVTLETLRNLATASDHGPDFISVGRLTHSAPNADFSMRIKKDSSC